MEIFDWSNFSVDYPNVVAEEFDGEVVVVNLVSGSYFHMEKTGAYLWSVISRGATYADLVSSVKFSVGCDPNLVDQHVQNFLKKLIEHSLIRENDAENQSVMSSENEALPVFSGEYGEPAIEVYSDLQDILLLDPVHDVDESGWPTARTTNS